MREWWGILGAQLYRQYITTRRYSGNFVSGMLTFYMITVAFYFSGRALLPAGVPVEPQAFSATVVGFLLWGFATGAVNVFGWNLTFEASTGTLEQLYMSPVSPVIILLGRSVANALSTLAMMSVVLGAATLTLGVRVQLPLGALAVILPLTVAGMYGFGFIVGGITLLWKRVQQVMELFQFVFLLFAGAMVPLDHLPRWLQVVGHSLPLSHGIEAARAVTVYGRTLGEIRPTLAALALNSALYLALGIGFFLACDRRARARGTVGGY